MINRVEIPHCVRDDKKDLYFCHSEQREESQPFLKTIKNKKIAICAQKRAKKRKNLQII